MNFENGKKNLNITPFGELSTSITTRIFNFKPTWGVTIKRYDKTETGTGASVSEIDGEFRLQSGTSTGGAAILQTKIRGQYVGGTLGQTSIGARVPVAPTGTQELKWGYYDGQNGFCFGQDATGVFVAYRNSGITTKIYQSNWNIDTLDGAGTSRLTLDLSVGTVCQIDFVWYGYGAIEFSIYSSSTANDISRKHVIHRLKLDNQVSIIDPNQPLRFEVKNGVTSTTNLSLYIGGHQFSLVGGIVGFINRENGELLSNYTTESNSNWQPLIAIRKKQTFNGRNNSVNVKVIGYDVTTDTNAETRLTWGATTSNLTWSSLTGVTSTETAVESKVTSGGDRLTVSSSGEPFSYGFTSSSKQSVVAINNTMGANDEVVLWVKPQSGNGTEVLHAHLDIEESW